MSTVKVVYKETMNTFRYTGLRKDKRAEGSGS